MDNEIYKMQQDAMKRVREMQRKAKLTVDNFENQKPIEKDKEIKNLPQKNKKRGFNNPLQMLNLKNIKLDNDSAIILLVLFLLSSEDVDEVLILALLYLLM